MESKKNIFVIVGSASKDSANQKLVSYLVGIAHNHFKFTIFNGLKLLPHFDPDLSTNNPPESIADFRNIISASDGILICTPEYIFSIPSGLKNAIEWCVATTIFSEKPTVLITAAANGEKAHEELILIMKTLMSKFTNETTLLIQGIKGKINDQGILEDENVKEDLTVLLTAFKALFK